MKVILYLILLMHSQGVEQYGICERYMTWDKNSCENGLLEGVPWKPVGN
jgi:hypothetical protein